MRRSTSRPSPTRSSSARGSRATRRVAFRRTLGMFATGVTVLTTRVGEQVHGMTAERVHVGLAAAAARSHLDRPAREDGRAPARGHALRGERARGEPDAVSRIASRAASPTTSRRPRFEMVHETPLVEGALAHLVGACRALVLGRRPLALPRPGRVRPLRGGPSASLPRRPLRALDRGPAGLLAPPARAARSDPRARRGARVRATGARSCSSATQGRRALARRRGHGARSSGPDAR